MGKAIIKDVLEEVEKLKKYTGGGTKEEAVIYNRALDDVIKILKNYDLA